MKIGYARVSTEEQNPDLQRQALERAGCTLIYEDQGVSGAERERLGLAAVLDRIGVGDTLVVWRLDRLGRSTAHLIQLLDVIGRAGAGFQSLTEAIDTTTAGGKLIFHVMAALAEFERSLISERTRAGMAAARRRGIHLGRPWKLTGDDIARARVLIAEGETRVITAARLGVHVTTLRRALRHRRAELVSFTSIIVPAGLVDRDAA